MIYFLSGVKVKVSLCLFAKSVLFVFRARGDGEFYYPNLKVLLNVTGDTGSKLSEVMRFEL